MKKAKLIFICSLMLILLTMTAAGAADSIECNNTLMDDESNMEEISTDADCISDGILGETDEQNVLDEQLDDKTLSFKDLRESIANWPSGPTLYLTNDYKYSSKYDDPEKVGIEIKESITIDGQGHTIDGNRESTIFRSFYASNHITLQNLILKNGYAASSITHPCGGAIYAELGEFTLINCTILNCYAYDDGGAIYVDSDAKVTLSNSILKDNAVESGTVRNDDGSGIFSKGTLIVENCKFTGNFLHADRGGAIYSSGDLYVSGSVFESNGAEKEGGAIYAKKISNHKVENCTFSFNHASNEGGAIYLDTDDDVTFVNCLFNTNRACSYDGGAIYKTGDGELILRKCNFTSNYVSYARVHKEEQDGGAFNDYKGGAVYVKKDLTVDSCIFINNYAENCGGAIYVAGGVSWEGSSIFIGNKLYHVQQHFVKRKGGAVYASKFKTDAKDLIFIDNFGEYGGAIYINDKNSLTFESCYFVDNVASLSGGGTHSDRGKGGAIYMDSRYGDLKLINNVFINNRAVEGQDVFNCGEYLTIKNNYWGTNDPDFDRDLLIEWHALSSNDKHKDSNPLKVHMSIEWDTIAKENVCKITLSFEDSNNNAVSDHLTDLNRIYLASNKELYNEKKVVLDDSVEFSVVPKDTGSYKVSAKIGDHELISINFNVMGDFEYLKYLVDKAYENEVINLYRDYTYSTGVDTITKGIVITKNLTINGNGHTIDALDSSRIFNIISGNVVLKNITFANGKADQGGAVYASGKNVVISDCNFTDNHASLYGGAVYLSSSNSNITGSKFMNNYIDQNHGGAIYCGGNNNNIIACEFIRNTALDFGGAISNKGQYTLVSNSTFINNMAMNGGAIYWNGENGKLEGSSFSENIAGVSGAAIKLISGLQEIKNSIFLDNNAQSDYLTSEIEGTTIKVRFQGKNNFINAINSPNEHLTFTNVTYWKGEIVNSDDVAPVYSTYAAGQKVNIEIHDSNNVLVKNVTLVTDVDGKASYDYYELDDGSYSYTLVHYDDSYYSYIRQYKDGEFDFAREGQQGKVQIVNNQSTYVYGNITVFFTVENRSAVRVVVSDADGDKIFIDELADKDNFTFCLPASTKQYMATVYNLGNQTHKPSMDSFKFYIQKATPTIHINDIGTVSYGDDVSISYTMNVHDKVIVSVTDRAGRYSNIIYTDQSPVVLSNLDIAQYEITVFYNGNENYTMGNEYAEFEVNNYGSNEANVSVSEATYGEESVIVVSAKHDGNYTVDINGTKVPVNVVGGKGTASIALGAGSYYANVTYDNPNYITVSKNTAFDVMKAYSSVEVYGISNSTYGNDVIVTFIAQNPTLFEVIVMNNASQTVFNKTTNEYSMRVSDLPVGQYLAIVNNLETENVYQSSNFVYFNVTMDNHVTVHVENVTYGDELFLIVAADVDGNYSVNINGTITNVEVIDGGGYVLLNLGVGQYYANVTAANTGLYRNVITNATFSVEKALSNVRISQVKYDVANENLTIKFNDDYATSFNVTVRNEAGNIVFTEIVNANSLNISTLPPGRQYNVTVRSIGNNNVTGSEDSRLFNITKNNEVFIFVDNVIYGENSTIVLLADVDGTYSVDINGKIVNINVVGGMAMEDVFLKAGSYYANVTFANDDYTNIITNTTFTVEKAKSKVIIAPITDGYEGDDVIVKFDCDNLTSFNVKVLNSTGVVIELNNTSEKSFTLYDLPAGQYFVRVDAIENENITGSYDYAVFVVRDYNIVVVRVEDSAYGEEVIVSVAANIDGNYTVDINGTILNVTVMNGIGNRSVSGLAAGNYYANVTFDSRYNNTLLNSTFTVAKAKSNVQIAEIKDVVEGDPVKIEFSDKLIGSFNVTVTNSAGDIVFSQIVNGNSVEIPNLAVGQYNVTVIAIENENVTGSEALASFNVAEKIQPKPVYNIVGNKDVAMYYFDGSKYSVKVVDGNGNVIAGQVVVFTLNKKTYYVKTDKNGIASLVIPKTVKPGKYIITAAISGKTVKNKITVKQNLKSKKTVKVKKSAKKLVLKATLKNGKKAVKGKKITFKFKGKTYKAKTNKKGVAKVTIKKKVIKKLKKGKKYKVKITYLKNTIKTTVKVK